MPETDQISEHPSYSMSQGEGAVVSFINATMASPAWNSSAIFLTWGDYGWMVRPCGASASRSIWVRLQSPPAGHLTLYAKQGYIDHTQGDFTSLLRFIESVYSLHPLTSRDAAAGNLSEAFDFSQVPRLPLELPGPFVPNHYPLTFPNGLSSRHPRRFPPRHIPPSNRSPL